MIGCCRGSHRDRELRLGKGLGLLAEIAQEVAALKLLRPAPLHPGRWEALFPEIGSIFARAGVDPRRIFTPVASKEKLGVGEKGLQIDFLEVGCYLKLRDENAILFRKTNSWRSRSWRIGVQLSAD